MVWLLLSIITNAGIYLLFKFYQRWKVDVLNVIVINYTVAATIGFLSVPDYSDITPSESDVPWVQLGVLLGLVFIGIFYLMAHASQRIGVGITTVASKMSLALSVVLLAWIDPFDGLQWTEVIALILATAGVVLVSWQEEGHHLKLDYLMYPLLIFAGSAVIDFGIAVLSKFASNESERTLFSGLSFAGAGITGYVLLLYRLLKHGSWISKTDLLCGIVLGVVNFGTIYFLVSAYHAGLFSRSGTLAVNNIAVVLVNTAAGYFFFREKFTYRNIAGVVLAIAGIALISSADQ